jgi:cell wall-associated NlpC family hydrolase
MSIMGRKVLLLTAVFAIVLICILRTEHAYAASTPSKKVKSAELRANTSTRHYKVSSRGTVFSIGNADGNSVVSYAKKFLGTKYKYGASGPDAFDCSGFTMLVMGSFGINLPHSAGAQSAYGFQISKENLRSGDLVFFATSGERRVSHVGIYIEGGNFIHASSGAGVEISSINKGYYCRNYVIAARLISQ